MSATEVFFDSNVLLYLLSADSRKADRAEELLLAGGTISVQVLNEFAAVASRKLKMSWSEIRFALAPVRELCRVVPLSIDVHERALLLSERHGFAFYDASIVSCALLCGCTTLYSEDMQHGRIIGRQLTIRNPFATGA